MREAHFSGESARGSQLGSNPHVSLWRADYWCPIYLSSGWNRARVWTWARPRSWMWSSRRRNIDHTSHSSKAVQGTEVTVSAGLGKSVFVNRARVRKDTRVTIHVIRGTELPVGCARGAAGNTVGVAAPGPSHGVAHRD